VKTFPLLQLFILAIAWLAHPASAVLPPAAPDFTAVDSYVEAQMKEARIPGVALAIVQDDHIVHLQGYGVADPAGRPVTPQTPFLIASTVKPFTALAIMQLVEAGRVELDAPVQRYLPWFRVADEAASTQITVRHLLTHTSGLSEAVGNEIPVSANASEAALEQRVRRLSAAHLNRPVGARFEYSSANYDTLGLIVQTVSGQPYETYVQQHIFAPLDMRRTFPSVAEAEPHGLATGYRSWFGFPIPFDAPRPRAYAPSGWTTASSAEDLAHFAIAALNGGRYGNTTPLNVSPEGLAAMQQPAVRSYNDATFYGLGWNVTTMSGVPAVWAGGDAMNFKTRLVLAPEQRLAVVVLVNMNSANVNSGRFELHRGVLSLLLGQQPAAVATSHSLQLYVTMSVILIVSLLFVAGMIRSVLRLRRRPATPEKGHYGWRARIAPIGLPLALALTWALLLLLGLPQVGGRSLPFLLLYVPDLGYMLIASAALALAWGIISIFVSLSDLTSNDRFGLNSEIGDFTSEQRTLPTPPRMKTVLEMRNQISNL